MRTFAAALFVIATAGAVQAAPARHSGYGYDRTGRYDQTCQCRARSVHHTTIRSRRSRYRAQDDGLIWAQTIDQRPAYYAPPPQVIVERPTYNVYVPAYGPPPPSDYYYGGYGGLPPADEGARLNPWNGYDPYRGLENGY